MWADFAGALIGEASTGERDTASWPRKSQRARARTATRPAPINVSCRRLCEPSGCSARRGMHNGGHGPFCRPLPVTMSCVSQRALRSTARSSETPPRRKATLPRPTSTIHPSIPSHACLAARPRARSASESLEDGQLPGRPADSLFPYIDVRLCHGINIAPSPEALKAILRPHHERDLVDEDKSLLNLDEDDGVMLNVRRHPHSRT